MSASSRDLSIPDGLILFLPAVPGMLFLYIAEVIPRICAGLGLELGLSGYALLEAVFIGCALSPAAGLPLYCWYFFRRGLGSNPLYPALLPRLADSGIHHVRRLCYCTEQLYQTGAG